jgi:hypothetical protein
MRAWLDLSERICKRFCLLTLSRIDFILRYNYLILPGKKSSFSSADFRSHECILCQQIDHFCIADPDSLKRLMITAHPAQARYRIDFIEEQIITAQKSTPESGFLNGRRQLFNRRNANNQDRSHSLIASLLSRNSNNNSFRLYPVVDI